MSKKIVDIDVMEELYRKGIISKTTLWRGKKRGYIILGYHQKNIGKNKLSEKRAITLYYYIFKLVGERLNRYLRLLVDDYNFKELQKDITGDVFLDLYERKSEEVFRYVNNKILEYMLRKKAYYRKYIRGEADLESKLTVNREIIEILN